MDKPRFASRRALQGLHKLKMFCLCSGPEALMQDPIIIDGVPFFAVSHHDGRFIRAPGLVALARRDPDGGYTIFQFELCEAINRTATSDHPRWAWALSQGLSTLLVHLAEHEAQLPGAEEAANAVPIRWHSGAQAPIGEPSEVPSSRADDPLTTCASAPPQTSEQTSTELAAYPRRRLTF